MAKELTGWRDEYENKDRQGCEVVFVSDRGQYAYFNSVGDIYPCTSLSNLIKKQKPKKYRPFTIDEVKCGMVFKDKRSSATAMVTLTGSEFIVLCDHKCTLDTLFIDFTFPDGSPAGMLED